MRWAVPSSKVGSLESASAAAERDSGVEAAAGFAGAGAGAAVVVPVGAAAAGLESGTIEFWLNALPVANSMATATKEIFRIVQIQYVCLAAPAPPKCTRSSHQFEILSRQCYVNHDQQ